jgi:hypothetical protein
VTNRNLVEACKVFYKDWLPVNEEALDRVKEGLATKAYELDEEFFFHDLKADMGLFTYFLRQARRKIQKREQSTSTKKSPLHLTPRELFTSLSKEEQLEIFDVQAKKISPHSFGSAEEFQAQQFKEALVSTSTAELLTSSQHSDGLLGFSVGSLEQVGRSLIAWNYPKVYEEALRKEKDPRRLDGVLTALLGFSPQLLVIALARDWGMSREIRSAVGDTNARLAPYHPQHEKVEQVSQMLKKLYDVGATLARAQNTELNPNAEEDWQNAKQSIESILGPGGVKEIQEKVKENCFFYLKSAPKIFESVTKLEPKTKTVSRPLLQEVSRNRYIRFCPREGQETLVKIYHQIEHGAIEKTAAIKELIKIAAPLSGFAHGAVYLLEPSSFQLTARLRLGKAPADVYRPIHAFSVSTRGNNPVGQAYHCNSPIIQSDYALSGVGNTCFASIIGKKQRLGVLYLEPDEELVKKNESNLLQRFKALVVAFEDILGIQ